MFGVSFAASAQSAAYTRFPTPLYSGPSPTFNQVARVNANERVDVFGCLPDYAWCDVSVRGRWRGWIDADAISVNYNSRNYSYYEAASNNWLLFPVVSFVLNDYWNRNYRDYGWYRDRDRYNNYNWQHNNRHWGNHGRPGVRPPNHNRPSHPIYNQNRPGRPHYDNNRPNRPNHDNNRPNRPNHGPNRPNTPDYRPSTPGVPGAVTPPQITRPVQSQPSRPQNRPPMTHYENRPNRSRNKDHQEQER